MKNNVHCIKKNGNFELYFNQLHLTFANFQTIASYLKDKGYIPTDFIYCPNNKKIGRNFFKLIA
tara:strand:- start:14295 stop:14486 length:192 start_codon:yes stop_codon:yes gene_type:complete